MGEGPGRCPAPPPPARPLPGPGPTGCTLYRPRLAGATGDRGVSSSAALTTASRGSVTPLLTLKWVKTGGGGCVCVSIFRHRECNRVLDTAH